MTHWVGLFYSLGYMDGLVRDVIHINNGIGSKMKGAHYIDQAKTTLQIIISLICIESRIL